MSATSLPPLAIAPAQPADLEPARRLLASAGLPLDGFAAAFEHALVARDGEQVVGCVALEIYGTEALLRSLVVAPEQRGRALGNRLTGAALELAGSRGARRVWLLTESADRFFPRFGFRRVERSELPGALSASAELRGACPASAVAMGLELSSLAG